MYLLRLVCLISFALFHTTNNLVFSQVFLENEIKITDSVMFFNGVNIGESGTVNNPNAYDFSFGNALTPHGDCIKTFKDFVFMTWYRGGKDDRHVMLSRYNLKTGVLKTIEFPHRHTGTHDKWWVGNTHNTIAVGICPKDSSVHMLYDMHRNGNVAAFADDYLRYSYTVDGAATVPDEQFTIDLFVNSDAGHYKHLSFNGIDNVTVTRLLTYPAFFTNDEGDLFLKNRFGYSANGRFLFARYDGNKWHGYTDFNRSNASNYGSEYNWGLYGDIKYVNGKIRIGFQRRSSNKSDKFIYQNGIYYAYSDDPKGLTQWKDHKGVGFTRPISNADLIKVAEPGDFVQTTQRDKVHIVGGFDWTVTDNEDVHIVSLVKDNQYNVSKKLHTFKKFGETDFNTVEYNAGSELYAAGNDVYVIGLKGGRVNIVKTKGGTSDFQEVYQHTSGPTFDKGVAYVHEGKLYYYLKQAGGTGDKRTVYLQVFDLDIDTTPTDTSRILSFKNLINGEEIEKGSNLSIEAIVGSAFTEVSLWLGETNLGTLTTAPYLWESHPALTNMEEPSYSFKLVARDSANVEHERNLTINIKKEDPPVFKADIDSLVKRLIFYCPLESDGTDLSGNENHAIPGSAVTFTPGKFGNAASFSHTEGSYLSSADSVYWYSHPTAYTIAFWLKVSDYSERGDILQPAEGRTLLYSNGDLTFRTFHQKNLASFSVDDNEKDEWFHVAMVIDQREGQTQHKFYINGVHRGSLAQGYALETDKPQSISRLVFGAASDLALSRNFTGMIDEIYMFNDVLSDDEIAFLVNTSNLMSLIGKNSMFFNFDNPDTDNDWILEGVNAATASIVDYDLSRNGSKALKVEGFSANTGFHFHNLSAGKIVASPGQYVHSIIHAANTIDGGQATASFKSEWASVTPGFQNISTAEMTRLTFRRQYPETEASNMDIFPRLRMKPSADLSNVFYFEDLVLYVHDSDETDLVAPQNPTSFNYISHSSTSNSFSWVEGIDELTGVQQTFILRNEIPLTSEIEEKAEAPVLLPQVAYSVEGGIDAPNTVSDWEIIASLAPGITSYTDESTRDGMSYTYAIVHRDLAYNYSSALLSENNDYTSGNSSFLTKYKIYPVPVKNTLYIDGGDIISAQVFNTSGMLLLNFKNASNGLDVSSLNKGFYVLKIVNTNGETSNLKFIIN